MYSILNLLCSTEGISLVVIKYIYIIIYVYYFVIFHLISKIDYNIILSVYSYVQPWKVRRFGFEPSKVPSKVKINLRDSPTIYYVVFYMHLNHHPP